RGASEVERRARTRPTGRRSIMVLETRLRVLGFAGSCEGPGELLTQAHAGPVQPRLHRRDRLLEDGGNLLVREVFDIPQDEHHAVVARKAVDRLLEPPPPLAREELFLWVLRPVGEEVCPIARPMAICLEGRQEILEGRLELDALAPTLVQRRVGGDSIDPASER